MAWSKKSEAFEGWDVKLHAVSQVVWNGGAVIWNNGEVLWNAEFLDWSGQGSQSNSWTEQ